ncbi:YihY/virulence factor BrkB family protein [Soehngenia saccharolytica]|nr:YihY/virulence factor BrkB family protein [Soehngenia saccharolytica]
MNNLIDRLLTHKPIIVLDHFIYKLRDDYIFGYAAQMAYYLVLSIFPFLIVLLNVLSLTPIVTGEMPLEFLELLPVEVTNIIEGFVKDIATSSSQGLLSIAAIAGLWTASGGMMVTMRSINAAYGFKEKRSYLKRKLLSLLFTVALLILIVMVFVTLVVGELLGKWIFAFIGNEVLFLNLWQYLRFIIPILYMIIIFALMYKYTPSTNRENKIKFKSTLFGSIFSTLGWIIASILFSYYVNNFGNYAVTYGSLGGVIVFLIWLYIISMIIILGGEINATLLFYKKNGVSFYKETSFLYDFFLK